MARDTIGLEIVKVQESLRSGNLYENLRIKQRDGKTMTRGIPVKLIGNTITFIEAAEFNDALANILEKQEFPLAHGYMWIEEAKLNKFITNNKQFTINKNNVTYSKEADYPTSGSGPGLKMGSKVDLKNLENALHSKNPLLEKLSLLKADKNNPPIFAGTDIAGHSELLLKNILLSNKIKATKDVSKSFSIYYYKDLNLTLCTIKIKKISNLIQSIDDFIVEDITTEQSLLSLVALEVEPKFGSQAGHVKAVQTQSLEEHIRYLDALIEVGEASINIEQELKDSGWDKIKTRASVPGINLKATGKGNYQIDKSTILYLKELKKRALKVYEDLVILDRIFLSAAASLSPDIDNIIEQAKILLTAVGGTGEAVFVKTIKDGKLDLNLMKIEIAYAIEALIPEGPFNQKKGGIAYRAALSYESAMKALAEAIKESLQNPKEVEKRLKETFSSSLLEIQLLLSLDKIFNTKRFSSLIDKRQKNKISRIVLSKNRSKNKTLFPKAVFRAAKLSRARKSSVKKRTTLNQQTTPNIVSLINAEIYKYVRAQMSENTLQYRTGEFARSVRVLSAQENAAVQYTYKKNPYSDVFSPGKSYLATEDRNPAKIIDAAIKRLGQDRFQKVFRTEEV